MALSGHDLRMLALGVSGDEPPSKLQPTPLPDGIHLRWAFDPKKGFPWYGYYLFRRRSPGQCDSICFGRHWSRHPPALPGALGTDRVAVGFGELSSDEPFAFSEDFAPSAVPEVDLRHRAVVRYTPPSGELIRRAEATVGFREPAAVTRRCADFRGDQPSSSTANPLTRAEACFTSFDRTGTRSSSGRMVARGGVVGWDAGYRAEIALPCAASRVEIELANLLGTTPTLSALDDHGALVSEVAARGTDFESVTLTGPDIASIRIEAPQDEIVVLRACWDCAALAGDGDDTVRLRACLDGVVVASLEVTGAPGSIKRAALAVDAIDEIQISGSNAALIDLCVTPLNRGLRDGWEAVPGFVYPLALPAADAGYPCPGKPATPAIAERVALNRVMYGPPPAAGVGSLLRTLGSLVSGGPSGGAMAKRSVDGIVGSSGQPPGVGGHPRQQSQRPLDLLLLASLHPSVAQMLGLYWCDTAALPGTSYDYLLIADHTGSLGGSAASALAWIDHTFDFRVVDGVAVFDKRVAPAVPLSPPSDVKAYALPGSTVAPASGGAVIDATNNAGLTWNRRQMRREVLGRFDAPGRFDASGLGPAGGEALECDAPVMYHVWRAALGDGDSPASPSKADFQALTAHSPLPVARSILMPPLARPISTDWPPHPLHYIDRALADGWYAYGVSGVDIFGRHSAQSASAVWHYWAPADRIEHPSAIRLLDKLAPPPPPGVEAFALDPADPNVVRDTDWHSWYDDLTQTEWYEDLTHDEKSNLIGLRVRWHWTEVQQQQAPDVREFRVYYHPAPLNALRGRVTEIVAASDIETDLVTDILNTQPADSYAGLSVRVGAESFAIVASLPGTPLRLRVRNVGPRDEVRPSARTRCTVSLKAGHALFKDFSRTAEWQDRLLAVAYGDVKSVDDATGNRLYEIFLPAPARGTRVGIPLTATLAEPMSAAVIGVTACDDKQHTLDHRGDPTRYGNESRIGGPATVFRVRREKPVAPVVPPDSEKVYASPADYHGKSYFTYRWLRPPDHLKVLVYRALDDAVWQADLKQRPRNTPLSGESELFPAEWAIAKREAVAAELTRLDTLDKNDKTAAKAAYGALSNDAWRVLAGLPGTEKVFMQITPQPLDPEEPDPNAPDGLRWRRVGPDVAAPGRLTSSEERAFVDALDGRGTNRSFYRCAHVDEVHNVGPLSLSSPPVWLPKVTPPVAPKIVRVLPGDRQVSLEWLSNREPDVAEYRVFRADDVLRSRDIRLMELVQTLAEPNGDPASRSPTVSWTDLIR